MASIRAVRGIRTFQDRLVHLLGATVEGRAKLVAGMLERNANEATTYWLQLVVSVGIATLGLVVGSVAVIIGAMLVAPLMVPIIALAMGLATGSPFLVLRSAGRILLSMAVAAGGAAIITLLLPFHELNTEIAARTSPTVLDLLTAGFCALAGVYASLRPGSDTAATAAGTSIGISLVPPLCASGYGLGTVSWPVAGGAMLLFLTNLIAIIFVGMIAFVAAGFNRVDAAALEREELAKNQTAIVTAAISRRLSGLFESKAGPVLRFLMPLALLATVYVPLRQALDEVAWQVRTRAAVNQSLARQPHRIVESRVRVERHEVDLLIVLVGKADDAEVFRTDLGEEIEKASGVAPRIEVLAIPDATAFAGLESTLLKPRDPLPIALPRLPSPKEQLEAARAMIRSDVERLWPAGSAGDPLAIEIGTRALDPLQVRVVHHGPELKAGAMEALDLSLSAALDRKVQLINVAIPTETLTRANGDLEFVSRTSAALAASAMLAEVRVCVMQPQPPSRPKRLQLQEQTFAEMLTGMLARYPRVTLEPGEAWSVRFVRGACAPATPDGTEAL